MAERLTSQRLENLLDQLITATEGMSPEEFNKICTRLTQTDLADLVPLLKTARLVSESVQAPPPYNPQAYETGLNNLILAAKAKRNQGKNGS